VQRRNDLMPSSLPLKDHPFLKDFQQYVADMVKERGFENETTPELFMLLLEECGELAKAARKTTQIKMDHQSESFHINHEVADVFIYLLAICNRFDIDLEQAFREKEEVNNKRFWK
jgi:NTP pyrophosphatase (non-canonical NTP hydrolase)